MMMDLNYYHMYLELRKLAHKDRVTLACALHFVYGISEENAILLVNLVSIGEPFDITLLHEGSQNPSDGTGVEHEHSGSGFGFI